MEKQTSQSQPNKQKGIMLSFVSLLLLGTLPVISNSRPQALNALNFSFYLSLWQLFCAVPLLFFEINQGILDKELPVKSRNQTIRIMFITGIIFSFSTLLYVVSFETAGTVSAAIAIQAYPLFSILLETIFLKRKKTSKELFFTSLLIGGIYFLGTKGTWAIEGFSPWFGLALTVPFLWSIAHVTIKNTLDKSPITPNQVTFLRVLTSSIILFVIAASVNGVTSVVNGLLDTEFLIYSFSMGFVYYLELVNWFYAVKHVDVSVASSITTPTPVITMILAILFLNESIEFYQLLAMGVVFLSLYGIIYFGKRKKTYDGLLSGVSADQQAEMLQENWSYGED
ncbi:MAG: DMT family transporter [Candidatus Odinarchaeota archaeon]